MKKKAVALILGMCMACSMAACSKSSDEGTEQTETSGGASETVKAERTTPPAVASVDMEIDLEKQVTKLCDYEKVPVTITGQYDMEQSKIDEIIMSDVKACYANLEEITDRDVVGENDVANIDFEGYMDGEKFDGGTAQGSYCKMGDGNGYIDGFTKDLVGAKVGDEVSTDVTFPDPYENNPDMAGKDATFKIKINKIYNEITDINTIKEMAKDKDSMVNTNINSTFGSYGITDFDSLLEYETNYIKNSLESQKTSDTVKAIREYMLKNCTVEVPEDYLETRLVEYQISYEDTYLSDDQTLAEQLQSAYGTTVEQQRESWKTELETQIKSELIFGLIAQEQKIELDEDEFNSFVSNIVSQSSSSATSTSTSFQNEDDVYKYFGVGNVENGKKYMKNLFLVNKAIDYVADHAKVTVKEEKDTEATEKADTTEK